MSFLHGKDTFIVLNDFNITGYLQKIETPLTADAPETTTFGHDAKTHIPGLRDGTLSAEGFYDGASNAVDEFLNDILATQSIANPNIISWYPQGNTLGYVGYGMEMVQTAYNVMATKDDAAKISLAGVSNVGRERLKMVHTLSAETVTGDETSVDLGAAGVSGSAGYLHVTGVSGSGSITVLIEQSTNDAFAGEETTLLTFTAATGTTYQRKVATGTTVGRYVRASWTISGFTSVTFLTGLCKK